MLQALDATQVRRWAVACVQSLDAHREAIDSINVYPVPDGDTGSNLLHTMRAALDALLRAPARARADAGTAMAVLARGALTGARGNSGVIVSQFLRGVAEELANRRPCQHRASASPPNAPAGTAPLPRRASPHWGWPRGTPRPEPARPGCRRSHPRRARCRAIAGRRANPSATWLQRESGGARASRPCLTPCWPGAGSLPLDPRAVGQHRAATGAGSLTNAGSLARTEHRDGTQLLGGTQSGSPDAAVARPAGPVVWRASRRRAVGAGSLDGAEASGDVHGRVDADVVLGPRLRAAIVRGAELAKAAMAEPVSGTMVTVFEAAAVGARDESSDALQDIVAAAASAAAAALDETPRQLAVLADAGVVDAGGRGVVVLFDAFYSVVTGQPAALAAAQRATAERTTRRVAGGQESSLYTSRESGSDAFAYEVMYLLEHVADDLAVDQLRDALVGLGDSVSVVGDGAGLWTVHVHCNDIGAAIEAGVDSGRPRQIRVARFADAPSAEASRFTKDRAVVVPSRSDEFADLLVREGVTVVQVDENDESVAQRLLETITRTTAAHVTVLPADPGLVEAADEASTRAVAAGQDVVVVPCASPVQVLAAVAVHDPRRRAGDDVVAMAEAAAATRRGQVVVATEAAITWIGACDAGDVLGFADGEVMLIEPGPADIAALDRAARGVVERMLAVGGELVTALLGAEAPDELATELEDFLRREHPETELVVYQGGQRDAALVLGVE